MKSDSASWPMTRTLVSVAALSGVLIVGAYRLTLPAITRNKAARLKAAVFEVIPGASEIERFVPKGADMPRMYAGYDEDGTLKGVAVEAQGQGFADIIKVLYGYSPARSAIIGMKVLESKETPGLGDKIEKDAGFRANFNDLDVSLDTDKTALKNPITVVKGGKKIHPWEIDAVSGATISSKAIGRLLNKSAGKAVPAIEGDLERLCGGRL